MARWSLQELRDRSGTSSARHAIALAATGVLAGAAIGPFVGVAAAGAFPVPGYHMKDVNQFSTTPYPAGATAVVVEGGALSEGGCPGATFSQVVNQTVRFMESATPRRTVTEITIVGNDCKSHPTIGGWSAKVKDVINSVEKKVLANHSKGYLSRYWGGVMLDEEAGYGYNAASLATLNQTIEPYLLLSGPAQGFPASTAPGLFTEDFAPVGSWTVSQYKDVVAGTRTAPQAYDSHMVALVDSACRTSSGTYSRPDCSIVPTIDRNTSPYCSGVQSCNWHNPSYVDGKFSSQVTAKPIYQWAGAKSSVGWSNRYVNA